MKQQVRPFWMIGKQFHYLEEIIFSSSNRAFLSFCAIILIIKSGIWVIPCIDVYRQISLAPFDSPPFINNQMAHYLFTSWLQPFIGWGLHLNTPIRYLALSLFFSILFTCLFALISFKSLGREAARKSLLFFISLPVGATSLYWVGYDGLTLLLMLLALSGLKDNRRLSLCTSLCIGILLGLQHFEQAILGFLLLLSYSLFGEESDGPLPPKRSFLTRLIILVAGITLGKLVLGAIINVNDIPLNSGRSVYLIVNIKQQLREFLLRFQVIVFSFLGVVWIPAIAAFLVSRKKFYWLATFIFVLGLSAVVPDQTRVVAIVTFPVVFMALLDNRNLLARLNRPMVVCLAVLYLIVPYSWVWNGNPQVSSFPYSLLLIQAAFRGINIDPSIWHPLPFIK